MKNSEYNNQANEISEASINKQAKEFSNTFDNGKISEYGSFVASKKRKPKKIVTIALVTGVAGGGLIAKEAIEILKKSKSEITISKIGENYVSFDYKTTDQGLTLHLHNDFVSEKHPIEYGEKDQEGFYHGSYTFESLKPNTNYEVSLDGESIFGETARASKSIRTLNRNYYGEFFTDDSTIYEDGIIKFQVKSLNLNITKSDTVCFRVVDKNGADILPEFIYENDIELNTLQSINTMEDLSKKSGYFIFEVRNNQEITEIFKKSFQYNEISIYPWKKHIITNFDFSRLNQNYVKFEITFDGLETSATNYVFDYFNADTNEQIGTTMFEEYDNPFELDISEFIETRNIRFEVFATVEGIDHHLVSEVKNLNDVLTYPYDIKVETDSSRVNQYHEFGVKLIYNDEYGFYNNIQGFIEDKDGRPVYIPYELNYKEMVYTSLDNFPQTSHATLKLSLLFNDVQYDFCNKEIELYHTSLPEEIVIENHLDEQAQAPYVYLDYVDLDGSYTNLYSRIYVENNPDIEPMIIEYEEGEKYCEIPYFQYMTFGDVTVELNISYKGKEVNLLKQIIKS